MTSWNLSGKITVSLVNNQTDEYLNGVVSWDPNSFLITTNGGLQSPTLGLGHELGHAALDFNPSLSRFLNSVSYGSYKNMNEYFVISALETPTAIFFGEGTRTDHFGTATYVPSLIPSPGGN